MAGNVFVDWQAIEQELGKSISLAEIVRRTGVSPHTAQNARDGKRMQRAKAFDVVRATRVTNPGLYIRAQDGSKGDRQTVHGKSLGSWEVEEAPIEYRMARDIPFFIGKVINKSTERVGRVKVFTLSEELNDEDIELARIELNRNPIICGRLERHPNFPLFYESEFVGSDRYWVIEKWEAGRVLADVVSDDEIAFDVERVPKMAVELAEALNFMNKAGCICRALTPKVILVRDDGSLLLRDFELATFTCQTFSKELKVDPSPYLAPEIGSPDIDVRADLYSWGQVVVFMLTGRWPQTHYQRSFFSSLPVPKSVAVCLEICTQADRTFRRLAPKSVNEISDFDSVLSQIENWK